MSLKRPLIPDDPSDSTVKKWRRIVGSSTGPPMPQPTIQPTTPDDAHAKWVGFGAALRGLEKCSGVVPPLKPAIKTIVECFKELPEVYKRRQEYCDLASDLAALINSLTQYIHVSTLEVVSTCVITIVNALQEDLTRIRDQQRQNLLSRIGRAVQEEDNLIRYYRLIEGHFRRLQINASLSMWSIMHEHVANNRLNWLIPAKQARYNSALSSEPRRGMCNPNTRVIILADLQGWANSPDSPVLYWMNGMAGTGKTTIAYSFCEALKHACQLGASFFCSRLLPDCRDVNRIVPTIAYQLARFSLPFQTALCETLASDPDIGQCAIHEQFEKLIVGPLAAAKDGMPTNCVVVVDALDECSDNRGTKAILDLLLYHATKLSVKFFITSRPEAVISDKMIGLDDQSRAVFVLHDIERSIVQADIETYISSELADLSPPPTPSQVRQLAQKSGNLFIHAATALRYICPDDAPVNSHSRLRIMLDMVSTTHNIRHSELDALYTSILTEALSNPRMDSAEVANIRLVLDTVVCAMEPLTTQALADLLGFDEQKSVELALKPLRSVIQVAGSQGLVSTLHVSFADYMLTRERSKEYFCHQNNHSELMAVRCLELMKVRLRFNICGLESSFVRDEDVLNLPRRVDEAIPMGLFYACCHWSDHLDALSIDDNSSKLFVLLEDFLSKRLLFWIEALNLKRVTPIGTTALSRAYNWLQRQDNSDILLQICQDAQRFITVFCANPTSHSTPHLYVSVLPFWNRKSMMWQHYGSRAKRLAKVGGSAMDRRGQAALAVWSTLSSSNSVAYSPDGTRVISGFHDGTIQILDAHKGTLIAGPLEGHTDSVFSVAFSPNGARAASGSDDRTIRIWDARRGDIVAGPFEGHTDLVRSVAFSPDGTRVVSGSYDKTIRIWDVQVGGMVAGPFEGPTGMVLSVAFSPDGTRVISGYHDETIRIWDIQSGSMVAGPLKGHMSSVMSIAFSPDGTRVVSGSYNETFRIWDAYSGDIVAGPFKGHTDSVLSVAFSFDGARVVSGSLDCTIQIWDAQSEDIVAGALEGHTNLVRSVAFSPDGTRVVSGSDDRTIRIWDAQKKKTLAGPIDRHISVAMSVAPSSDGIQAISRSHNNTIQAWDVQNASMVVVPLVGHKTPVLSVVFSSDGTRVISISSDHMILICDAQGGGTVAQPLEGHTGLMLSVAFSSDGTRVVSGYHDENIRIWDAQSGEMVAGPPKGHKSTVMSVSFSPDGTHVVSGSLDCTLHIWDAQRGYIVAGPFEGHTGLVRSVAFSPNGTRVVSGSDDQTIRIWDVQSGGTVAGPLKGHTGMIMSVAFSFDSTRVVSGSHDHTIRIWDARNGETIAGPFKGHTSSVTSVAFSPDGTRVVSGSYDCTVRIWDAYSGDMVTGPFKGHTESVLSVAFSSDGAHVASGSDDCSIRIWDAQKGASSYININADWDLDQHGWVTNKYSQLLLWTPSDLRYGLKRPHNTHIIHPNGFSELCFDDASIGPQWHNCFS